jgi:hypothetical protein
VCFEIVQGSLTAIHHVDTIPDLLSLSFTLNLLRRDLRQVNLNLGSFAILRLIFNSSIFKSQ